MLGLIWFFDGFHFELWLWIFWWITCWTMMDLMMDYDGYFGYMMLRLIYVSLVILSIFPRAWPVGCIGLFLFVDLDFSVDGLDAKLLMLCLFPAHYKNYQHITKMPTKSISQLVMLWVTMLMITIYIFLISDLIYQEWWKKSAKIRLDDWWTVMLFMRYFFDCYNNFKQLVIYMICLDIVYSFWGKYRCNDNF